MRALRREAAGPLLLDFSLVAPGGSLTHAEGFLTALAGARAVPAHLLVALPRDAAVLAGQEQALVTAGVETTRIGTKHPAGSWPSRVSGQVALPLLARRTGASLVFVAREVGPLLLRRSSVLFAANVLRWEEPAGGPPRSARVALVARIKTSVARRAVARSVLVIAPSQRIADLLPPGVRTAVVPLGVDLGRVPPKDEPIGRRRPLRIVALGSISRHKRLDVIIDLVGELVEHHGVDAVLDIWGSARRPEEMARVATHLEARLGERGRLRGYLEPDQRASMLAQADVFVLGSGTESFGFPLIEAMRTATLVVAPDAAVAREACGEHAVYYPEGDAAGGAERLAALFEPDRAGEVTALVVAAQERSKQFTWEACVAGTLAVLEVQSSLGMSPDGAEPPVPTGRDLSQLR